MNFRNVLVVILVVLVLVATSCSRNPGPQPPTPTVTSTQAAPNGPALSADMEEAFKALDKLNAEDNITSSKEYEAIKAKAQELAKKRDKDFIDALFIMAENGTPVRKKAANELLCYVISDYKGSDWPDHAKYRDKAIVIVTTHPDKQFRRGCWDFLTYYYEPENITPPILKAYAEIKDKNLQQEILERIGGPAASCFIEKNEEALNKICLPIAKDDKETQDMRVAALEILAYSGRKDPAVKTALEALKNSPDERIKEKVEDALKKIDQK
jgi:hypothetical protein